MQIYYKIKNLILEKIYDIIKEKKMCRGVEMKCNFNLYFSKIGLAFQHKDGQWYSYKNGEKIDVTGKLICHAKNILFRAADAKEIKIFDFILYKDQIYQLIDVDEIGRPIIYSTYDDEIVIMPTKENIDEEIFIKLENPWEKFFEGEVSYSSLVPLFYLMNSEYLADKYIYENIIKNGNGNEDKN